MARREKSIETATCDSAIAELQVPNVGLKLLLGANTGWPDRLFFLGSGAILLIEFKDPNEGEVAPKQQYMIDLLLRMGYNVQIHDNKDEALQAIRTAKLEAARLSEKSRKVPARTRRRYRAP